MGGAQGFAAILVADVVAYRRKADAEQALASIIEFRSFLTNRRGRHDAALVVL